MGRIELCSLILLVSLCSLHKVHTRMFWTTGTTSHTSVCGTCAHYWTERCRFVWKCLPKHWLAFNPSEWACVYQRRKYSSPLTLIESPVWAECPGPRASLNGRRPTTEADVEVRTLRLFTSASQRMVRGRCTWRRGGTEMHRFRLPSPSNAEP